MRLVNCGATFLACSVAIAAGSTAATARPSHHHRHLNVAHHAAHHSALHRGHRAARSGQPHEAVVAVPMRGLGGPGSMPTYQPVDGSAAYASVPQERRTRHARGHVAVEQPATFGGFGGMTFSLPVYAVFLGIHDLPVQPLQVTAHSEENWILLGRDVLNGYPILLDGPRLAVEIQ